MTPAGLALVNTIALIAIATTSAVMICRRRWDCPDDRRDLCTAAAFLLVACVGMARRIGVTEAVVVDLAAIGWTVALAAYAYKLSGLINVRRPRDHEESS